MKEVKWSIPIGALVAKAKGDIEKVARTAIFQMFTNVVNMSPVDTGRFRANWNFSYLDPDFNTTGDVDQSRGQAEAAKALTFKIGDVAYLCNGLPYAQRLEYGWSGQAPNGMVRLSAYQFQAYLRDAVAKTNS